MAEAEHAVIVTRKEKRVAGSRTINDVVEPNRSATDGRTELVESFRLDKPKVGVGLFWSPVFCFEWADVVKLRFSRVVATQHDTIVPAAEVPDNLEIVGAWSNAQFGGSGTTYYNFEIGWDRYEEAVYINRFLSSFPVEVEAATTSSRGLGYD